MSSWKVRGKTVQGTNLERMASGRAPVGYDGKSVELHHLTQNEVNGLTGTRGALAEVGSVFHSQNSSILQKAWGQTPWLKNTQEAKGVGDN